MDNKRVGSWFKVSILCLVCFGFGGCALLSLPGQIIGGTFQLLGQLLNIAEGLPKPPPGVFF